MGIFSHDEDPDWSQVFALQERIEALQSSKAELEVKVTQLEEDLQVEKSVKRTALEEASKYAKLCGAYRKFYNNITENIEDLKMDLENLE